MQIKNYDIKAVFQNGKDIIYKNVYMECNKTNNLDFELHRSTIPSENIDCSQEGKNKMLYDIMKDIYLWYEYTPDLDYTSYNNMDKLLNDLKYSKI